MIEQHLHLLACPDCRGELRLLRAAGDRGGLLCDACRLAFPIDSDIPILLPRGARNARMELPLVKALAEAAATPEDRAVIDATVEMLESRAHEKSWEWEDEEFWGETYRQQIANFETGQAPPIPRWPVRLWQREFLVAPLPSDIWGPGKVFLDVGCGAGHNFRLLLAPHVHESALYIAADVSLDGLKLNRLRNPHANGLYILCSADRLPLRSGSVDVLTYFGILHHTERKAGTIHEDARLLVPGGFVLLHEAITRASGRPGFLPEPDHGSAHEETIDRDDLLGTLARTPALHLQAERWGHTVVIGATRKILRRFLRSRGAYEAVCRLDQAAARWLGGTWEIFQPSEVLMLLTRADDAAAEPSRRSATA